jgi:hypothetical protein
LSLLRLATGKFRVGFPLLFGFCWFGLTNRCSLFARKWSRLLPADSLAGSFQTAQAEYLYGNYQNQWIAVRQGSVVEAVPDPTSAGRIIALTLSQNPSLVFSLLVPASVFAGSFSSFRLTGRLGVSTMNTSPMY